MISALLFLYFQSAANRIRAFCQRLKQPKYLIGSLGGLIYLYWFFIRGMMPGKAGLSPAMSRWFQDYPGLAESLAALLLLQPVAWVWIVSQGRAALSFTEAEMAFLFPAPVSRRALIHFKLFKSQAAILVTACFLTLFSGRFLTGGGLVPGGGLWVAMGTLNLHSLGASFSPTWVFDRGGLHGHPRLSAPAVASLAMGTIIIWAVWRIPPPKFDELLEAQGIVRYANVVLSSGPAPWILLPLRLLIRPVLASNAAAFLLALGPALVLLVLHYFWVIRANVAFEEASLELARQRSERIAAAKAGLRQPGINSSAKLRARAPFRLSPVGRPWVALCWKNLIGTQALAGGRLLIVLGIIAAAASLIGYQVMGAMWFRIFGLFSACIAVYLVLLGPGLLNHDLRQDLRMMDVLKLYPLKGWEVALGELLAPAVLLSAVQWVLLATGVILCDGLKDQGPSVPILTRLVFGLGGALLLPVLNLINLLILNTAVLMFPAWSGSLTGASRGFETIGQFAVMTAGQILVLLLVLLPGVVVFAAMFFLGLFLGGLLLAVLLGALAAAMTLAVEIGLGFAFLGRVYDRFDLSRERS
jgi:ABC-2 type transport system permease protein